MLSTITLITLFQIATPGPTSASVSTPSIGYSLAAAQLVHFTGIPGAAQATFDPSGDWYTQLKTASAGPYAILVPAAPTSDILYLTPNQVLTIPLAQPATNTAVSPSGSYFVALTTAQLLLYNRAGTLLAAMDYPAVGIPPTCVTDLLVSDLGEIILTSNDTLWYSPKDAASFTAIPMALTYARFKPHDHLLIAFDPGQGRLIAVHPTAAFAREPLLTPDDHLTPLTGLQFSADGSSVWFTQQTGPLEQYDFSTRTTTSFAVPDGILSTALAPGVFLWSQANNSTTILDTTQTNPAVLIVPNSTGAFH